MTQLNNLYWFYCHTFWILTLSKIQQYFFFNMRATGLVVVEAQGFLVNSSTRPCDHVALTFSTTVEVCGSIHLETDCWTVWLSHTLLTFHLWKWFPAERHFLSMEPISVSSCSVCTGTDLLQKLNLWEILCVLKTHISSLNWWNYLLTKTFN